MVIKRRIMLVCHATNIISVHILHVTYIMVYCRVCVIEIEWQVISIYNLNEEYGGNESVEVCSTFHNLWYRKILTWK